MHTHNVYVTQVLCYLSWTCPFFKINAIYSVSLQFGVQHVWSKGKRAIVGTNRLNTKTDMFNQCKLHMNHEYKGWTTGQKKQLSGGFWVLLYVSSLSIFPAPRFHLIFTKPRQART